MNAAKAGPLSVHRSTSPNLAGPAQAPVFMEAEVSHPTEVLFRGIIRCGCCRARQPVGISRCQFAVLQRQRALDYPCPRCGLWTPHHFLRLTT